MIKLFSKELQVMMGVSRSRIYLHSHGQYLIDFSPNAFAMKKASMHPHSACGSFTQPQQRGNSVQLC